jgi:outer membrane receptor protein involved in Fe transport
MRKSNSVRLAVALVLAQWTLGTAMAAPPAEESGATYSLDIPAQSLNDALQAVALASKHELLYSAKLVEGKSSAPLKGIFTAQEAVKLLLVGTDLEYEVGADGVVVIKSKDSKVSSLSTSMEQGGAEEIRLAQTKIPSSTPPGEIAAGMDKGSAPKDSDQLGKAWLEEIVVTGTSIRGAAPVGSDLLVIDREQIQKSGYGDIGQVIQSLPQNFGGGASQTLTTGLVRGGANSNQTRGTGINLRGLGNGATLTLIDGHRLAPAGFATFVDISTIPLSVVERIEVLADGASAVYGSDAIGGVVNIITRTDFDGAETEGRFGHDANGDRQEYMVSQTLGHAWSTGSVTASFTHNHQDALDSADRSFAEDVISPTDLAPDQSMNSGYLSYRQQLGAARLNSTVLASRRQFDQVATDVVDQPRFFSGEVKTLSGAAQLGFNLGETWQLDLIGTYSRNDQQMVQRIPAFDLLSNVDELDESTAAEARTDGVLFQLPAGDVRAAFGAAYRKEESEVEASYAAHRQITSAYAEIRIPLVAGPLAQRGIQSLTLSLAGRFDHYSDFGDTFNPKMGLEWKVLETVALTGTYSTSFRAPVFFEQRLQLDGFVFDEADPQSIRPDGLTTVLELNGGNPNLDAETARSWTTGVRFRPASFPTLSIEVTYFDVRFKDRIVPLNETYAGNALINEAFIPNFIARNPDDALVTSLINTMPFGVNDFNNFVFGITDPAAILSQYTVGAIFQGQYQNVGAVRVRGTDLDMRFSKEQAFGTLSSGLNVTLLSEYSIQPTPSSRSAKLLNTAFNPIDLRARAFLGWARNRWSVSTFLNYVDDYEDPGFGGFSTAGRVSAWTTFDAQVAYEGADHSGILANTHVALSATNLFDKDPPHINAAPAQLPYDGENANPYGRLLSLAVSKRW